jgi:hypothetical protein
LELQSISILLQGLDEWVGFVAMQSTIIHTPAPTAFMNLIQRIYVLLVSVLLLQGQSTQGLILGRVYNAKTGRRLASAEIYCRNLETSEARVTFSDAEGQYAFPQLSPGTYWLRVEVPPDAVPYQPREASDVWLAVSGRVEINFPLRLLTDVYNQELYAGTLTGDSDALVHIFAADADRVRAAPVGALDVTLSSLQSSVSYAIDTMQLSNLPLSGRNVYQLLSFQPGMTSSLIANGQESALFLLDGVSSPTGLGPEFVQEYRVSTGNFSSEFGRTTGFIGNAITKAGSNAFRGLVYAYVNNEALNANAFQSNSDGFPRLPYRYIHTGFWTGGPVHTDRTFFSAGYEYFRSRTEDYPYDFQVPILDNFRRCAQTANSQALSLLERFPPPVVPHPAGSPCDHLSGTYRFSIPIAINRGFALARIDHLLRGGKDRLMVRAISNRETDPDSVFTLYEAFTSARKANTTSVAFDGVHTVNASVVMELRGGWEHSTNDLPRAQEKIPTLSTATDGGKTYTSGISLPGVSSSVSAQRTKEDLWEIENSTTINRSRHLITFGGGTYFDYLTSLNNFLQSGEYQFNSLQNFGQDMAEFLQLSVSRGPFTQTGALTQFNPVTTSRRVDFFGFFQDSFRVTQRFTLNLGTRYDYFGVPYDRGGPDAHIRLGPENSLQGSISTARFVFGPVCCPSPYRPDRKSWGPRVAMSYDLTGSGKHFFRAAYGVLYDRTPGPSTTGNNIEVVTLYSPTGLLNVDYSKPLISQATSALAVPVADFPQPVLLISPSLAPPLVQSWFAGLQHRLSANVMIEANYTGSSSNNLITTDLVNRTTATNLNSSRMDTSLPFGVAYTSNAGYSRYNAGTALIRYRSHFFTLQTAYTLSHSIDNNSGYFTRQYDRQLDRASSDFDQRQNLVIYGIFQSPSLKGPSWMRAMGRGWTLAALLGFRSGYPYTVDADTVPGIQPCAGSSTPGDNPVLYNNRASLVPGISPVLSQRIAVPGGVQLLNPQAFCMPAADVPGNLGRNSFAGPGYLGVDLSAGKSFGLKWLSDSWKLQLRADFYNAFNHANLGDPIISNTGYSVFGQAFYGKSAIPPSSISVVPLDETPRRIELQVRVSF